MNRLANSCSPYLLQHAANPVDWYPWGDEALRKAKDENKLILVSIGYSACHWCHVMEHESFEDHQVAAVMNEHFVCIKVDREERPDVDQIYMSAVQLMTGRGGWPLNCFCLPDQRPIYGGTYFRKNDWVSLLFNLADFYKQKPLEAEEYAEKLTEGIRGYESVKFIDIRPKYSKNDLGKILENWERYFDRLEGGMGAAPKFPMPNNWQFLMRFAFLMQNDDLARQVSLTLHKMAYGGIYDHIGGGFARYSVDGLWHVPHFEKMLYDNAQLVSLYSEAAIWQFDPLYPQIVDQTISFIERELSSPEGGFYSALDADSEGVEGKFYTFTKSDIVNILGSEAGLFCRYYHVTAEGNWQEEQTNIFFRSQTDEQLAAELGLSTDDLVARIGLLGGKVLQARSGRIRPGLDYKILSSWNGLMLKALCEAYRSFSRPGYLELALKNAKFILGNLMTGERLTRIFKPGAQDKDKEIAFLDDYANIAEAFIALYEVTFDETWLEKAKELTDQAIENYYDPAIGMFYFTASGERQLIARKSEIIDGVVPSSNSVMAHNLKKLGLLFEREDYLEISAQMLRNVAGQVAPYGSSYSNWCMLLLSEVFGVIQVAITGEQAEKLRAEMEKNYLPGKIILGGKKGSLPLLEDKFAATTRIFICKDKTCGLPSENTEEALKQIWN